MLSSAATFGFFLSIGSVSCLFGFLLVAQELLIPSVFQVIRNDAGDLKYHPAMLHAREIMNRPILLGSRSESIQRMKARYALEKLRA
jgi:hypothetical protein